MKIHVIHDERGELVGTLRAEPQTLKDGREVMAVCRLEKGQKSQIMDVPGHLKGSELHAFIEGQSATSA